MPVIKVYQHGFTIGTPPMKNDHKRAPRGVTQGWTDSATRNNTAFLRSVTLEELTGNGFSFTLTVKHCPASSDDWKLVRERIVKRLKRLGLIRLHWVTEWQRRGVPHLHGVVYFPSDAAHAFPLVHQAIIQGWCDVAADYGPALWSQDCKPINNARGWLQYLGKHADRGKYHYQRSAANVPEGWKKTGRVWGKIGNWPTEDCIEIDAVKGGAFRVRRLVRAWRVAQARKTGHGPSIRAARRILRSNNRQLGEVRGTSEWIPRDLALEMVGFVSRDGYTFEN